MVWATQAPFPDLRFSHMSKGYTIAFAITAPVAPATARPQGGMSASFDCPAILMRDLVFADGVERVEVLEIYPGSKWMLGPMWFRKSRKP